MFTPPTTPRKNLPCTPGDFSSINPEAHDAIAHATASTLHRQKSPAFNAARSQPRSRLNRALGRLHLRVLGVVSPQAAARRGVELFCTPACTASTTIQAVSPDNEVQPSLLKVDSHELATYVWGDPVAQPYVLLAHGWSSHSLHNLAWVEALRAAGYAVVAFDQQAHGRSSGYRATLPDFICNLLAVGWRHGRAAAIIGHALGGTAAALALQHGLEADRAILIAPQADQEEAINRFVRCNGLGNAVRRRMIALLESDTGVALDDLQAHRIVPNIGRPALVIHDLQDLEVPWSEGERYARHWPHSRLLTTEGLGHHAIARDARVIAACIAFLGGNVVGDRVVSSPNLPYGLA